jgi:hypothetical protein
MPPVGKESAKRTSARCTYREAQTVVVAKVKAERWNRNNDMLNERYVLLHSLHRIGVARRVTTCRVAGTLLGKLAIQKCPFSTFYFIQYESRGACQSHGAARRCRGRVVWAREA